MSDLITLDLSNKPPAEEKKPHGKLPGSRNTKSFLEAVIGKHEVNKRFVDAFLRTQHKAEASKEVFGDSIKCHDQKAHAMMKRPEVRALLKQSLASANASPLKAAQLIADATHATKLVGRKEKEVPDHAVRLKSADMIIKVFDGYPGSSKEGWEGEGSKHLHLHMQEPLAVQKFILLNGRLPDDQERQKLVGDVIDVQVENG